MKTISSLPVLLACLVLSAQEAPCPAGAGLAERFKQLDRSELPGALFDRLDANKGGFVTAGSEGTLAGQITGTVIVRTEPHRARFRPPPAKAAWAGLTFVRTNANMS